MTGGAPCFDPLPVDTDSDDAATDLFDAAADDDARIVSTSPSRARSAGQTKPPTFVRVEKHRSRMFRP